MTGQRERELLGSGIEELLERICERSDDVAQIFVVTDHSVYLFLEISVSTSGFIDLDLESGDLFFEGVDFSEDGDMRGDAGRDVFRVRIPVMKGDEFGEGDAVINGEQGD